MASQSGSTSSINLSELSHGRPGEFAFIALAFAGLCVLADMALAARTPYWLGWTATELGEAVIAWFIYAAPLYVASFLGFVLASSVRRLHRLRWWLRFLAILIGCLAMWAAVMMAWNGIPLNPWLVLDFALLTLVVILNRMGRRSLVIPAATAVVSIAISGILLNWSAESLIGYRSDPASFAAITNRLVLIALLSGACHAVYVGSAASERLQRNSRYYSLIAPFLVLGAGAAAASVVNRPLPANEDSANLQPNLIIVTADALRADYCSAYGGAAETPALERLARDGSRFDRFYSLAPWTLPSLYGLFSSKYPPGFTPAAAGEAIPLWKKEASTYALIEAYWTDSGEPLMTELKAKGYRTAAAVGNPLLRPGDWLLNDVEELRTAEFAVTELRGTFRATPALQSVMAGWWPDAFVRRPVDMTRVTTQFAEAYLRYARNQPFMLWVHYFDPHGPYDPPAEYRTLDGPWPQFPPEPYHTMSFWDQFNWIKDMPDADRAYVQSLYRGEIEYMDAGLKRILDAIEANGLAEKTYVVFSSDHGEEFWDHGKWEHGHSLYEDQIRVPLIVRGPGVAPGAVDGPVSAVDVLPTIREWLGLPELSGAHGASLAEALSSRQGYPQRTVFVQATSFYTEPLQTVIVGDSKAIYGTHSGTWSLYDLGADPEERSNLAVGEGDTLTGLQSLVEQWRASFPITFDELEIDAGNDRVDEFEEMLKSMGYVN